MALKNYFTWNPSAKGLGTQNPRSQGVKAIFAKFCILIFFKITSFFLQVCAEILNFFMINNGILHVFLIISCCGAADMNLDFGGVVLRSNPVSPTLFY